MTDQKRYNVWYRNRSSGTDRKQLGPWFVVSNIEGDRKPLTRAEAEEVGNSLEGQIWEIIPAGTWVRMPK